MKYIETLDDLKQHLLFVIPPKHLAELIKHIDEQAKEFGIQLSSFRKDKKK